MTPRDMHLLQLLLALLAVLALVFLYRRVDERLLMFLEAAAWRR